MTRYVAAVALEPAASGQVFAEGRVVAGQEHDRGIGFRVHHRRREVETVSPVQQRRQREAILNCRQLDAKNERFIRVWCCHWLTGGVVSVSDVSQAVVVAITSHLDRDVSATYNV